jgi:hypothetical protein
MSEGIVACHESPEMQRFEHLTAGRLLPLTKIQS